MVAAQSPVGDPFPINEFTPGTQRLADVARQPERSFVVVWQSDGADGDGTAVRARRLSRNGNPLSGEFPVNQMTVGNQLRPRVATDSQGNFVVVWYGPDQDAFGVFARLFATDGTALGPEFQVNTQTLGTQRRPEVSRGGAGDFLISWTDASSDSVVAATFDASGSIGLPEFVVNTSGNYPSEGYVAAGLRSDGGFAVAWTAEHDVGGFPAIDTFQRRYASDGTPLSGEFQVSHSEPYGYSPSYRPDIGVDESDNFLVVWHDQLNLAWGGVRGRRTDAAGVSGPIKELAIESVDHAFSMAPTGEFVVVWEEYSAYGEELSAARFDPLGNEVALFTVPDVPGIERASAQAHLSGNASDFVLVRGVDAPDWDLIGQRFEDLVFVDGFESGDTSQWSQTVP
jgi:hypothetical protein